MNWTMGWKGVHRAALGLAFVIAAATVIGSAGPADAQQKYPKDTVHARHPFESGRRQRYLPAGRSRRI